MCGMHCAFGAGVNVICCEDKKCGAAFYFLECTTREHAASIFNRRVSDYMCYEHINRAFDDVIKWNRSINYTEGCDYDFEFMDGEEVMYKHSAVIQEALQMYMEKKQEEKEKEERKS